MIILRSSKNFHFFFKWCKTAKYLWLIFGFDDLCQIFEKLFTKNMKGRSVKSEIVCVGQLAFAEKTSKKERVSQNPPLGPEGNILVNSSISTVQQGLTHSALSHDKFRFALSQGLLARHSSFLNAFYRTLLSSLGPFFSLFSLLELCQLFSLLFLFLNLF